MRNIFLPSQFIVNDDTEKLNLMNFIDMSALICGLNLIVWLVSKHNVASPFDIQRQLIKI